MHGPTRPAILVVDDELCVREALAAALRAEYVVHAAASGLEALACLRAHPIAAIILDAVLEGEHGLDLVERFQALSSAPILLITGYGSEELAGRAVWAGVRAYLKKPVSLPALYAALERLLPLGGGSADPAARARRYLDEHPARRFRAAALAGQLGVSEAHLRRIFRDAYGTTPRQHLLGLRVRRAAELLHTTEHSIKQIAQDAGFANERAFRHTFTRLLGLPPRACRARARRARANRRLPAGGPCPGCPKTTPFCPKIAPLSA